GRRPLRRRTGFGWEGVSSRRQDLRCIDSSCFWTRRRKSSHLDRMGFSDLLECIRGEPRNAWERDLLRSTPGQCRTVSCCGKSWFRTCEKCSGPYYTATGIIAFLPACNPSTHAL